MGSSKKASRERRVRANRPEILLRFIICCQSPRSYLRADGFWSSREQEAHHLSSIRAARKAMEKAKRMRTGPSLLDQAEIIPRQIRRPSSV